MPIYRYLCHYCGWQEQQLTTFKDALAAIPCQQCGKIAERQWGRVATIYRGEGFYSSSKQKANDSNQDSKV